MTVLGVDYFLILTVIMLVLMVWNLMITRKETLPWILTLISLLLILASIIMIGILSDMPNNYALYNWIQGLFFVQLIFTLIIRTIARKGEQQ